MSLTSDHSYRASTFHARVEGASPVMFPFKNLWEVWVIEDDDQRWENGFRIGKHQVDWDAGPTDVANVEVLLLRQGTSDSGPDMSFDTSASLEYMSGLDRASLARVVGYVSPLKIPG
ncbi:hypothetical protein Tco_1120597 [Tanacetum coccineum]